MTTLKTCSYCGVRKRISEFHAKPTAKDGLRSWCRECHNAKSRAWNSINRDRKRETDLAWQSKNRDRVRSAKALWIATHLNAQSAHRKAWKDANPDKTRADSARRRAQRKRHIVMLSPAHIEQIRCVYAEADRLTRETGIRHHVDHIVPLNEKSVSGLHVPWNLQVITAADNMRKRNKFESV